MSAGPEDILQMQAVRFLKLAAPELLFMHVPNGGYRNPREARKLKDMGVLPGVADLAFILPKGRIAFIELKAGRNGQTDAQEAFADECRARDVPYEVCRSIPEIEACLRSWGVAMRGSVL